MQIRKLTGIGSTYRNLRRYERILAVLISHGFDEFLVRIGLRNPMGGLRFSLRRDKTKDPGTAIRLRDAFEELGSTFIKIGQILSTRPDLLSEEYILELQHLQSGAKPFSVDTLRSIIEQELKAPLEEFFAYFDPTPLGCASLAQVHRAQLHTGEHVVIKVQRPNIKAQVEADLEIILYLATLAENHVEEMKDYKPVQLVQEFSQALEKELDFRIEGSNTQNFHHLFKNQKGITTLKCFEEFTTEKVLVLEYAPGEKASTPVQVLHQKGHNTQRLAEYGVQCLLEQIFIHGFFHADPHPGNIIITPDSKICFLDFGMIGRLNTRTRLRAGELILSLANRDEARSARLLLKLCQHEGHPDMNALERTLREQMDMYLGRPLTDLRFSEVLISLFRTLHQFKLYAPPELSLVMKAVMTLEDLGKKLHPTLNLIEHIKPVLAKAQLDRFDPGYLGRWLLSDSRQIFEIIQELPDSFSEILQMARRGKFMTNSRISGSPGLYKFGDRLTKRLSYSMVLSALIMGSALIVLADIPPKWGEIPIIGMSGFVASSVLAFLYLFRD
jgi:ubiquinone biosynthesis protein